MRRRYVLLLVGLVLALGLYAVRIHLGAHLEGDIALARSDRPGLRVLFVGNSFTAKNDLAGLVHRLAVGGRPVFAVSYTAPGWRLKRAAGHRGLAKLLHEVSWDVVVLQEQSGIPSTSEAERAREFDPYVAELDRKIRSVGAQTLLFLTWGYDGDGYHDMQQRLAAGYQNVAWRLRARIAPVGTAWAEALRRRPDADLWARDGRHPTRLGSYLAACTFYAVLTGNDPRATRYTAGLDPRDARFAQSVARDAVRRAAG